MLDEIINGITDVLHARLIGREVALSHTRIIQQRFRPHIVLLVPHLHGCGIILGRDAGKIELAGTRPDGIRIKIFGGKSGKHPRHLHDLIIGVGLERASGAVVDVIASRI